jgi:hypothetical protein
MSTLFVWLVATVRRAGWAPIAVFLLHLLFSKGLELYRPYPHLDLPMHALGGAAIGWFAWCATGVAPARAALGVLTRSGRMVVGLLGLLAATVVWEFAEWTTDGLGLTRAQGGQLDTMVDMALGAAGGCLVVGLAAWRGR